MPKWRAGGNTHELASELRVGLGAGQFFEGAYTPQCAGDVVSLEAPEDAKVRVKPSGPCGLDHSGLNTVT